MEEVAKPLLKKGGYALASLSLDWTKIVGTEIAAVTKPLRFTASKDLVIQVEPAAALIIGFQKGLIIERIIAFFGKPIVKNISFYQHPFVSKKQDVIKREEKPLTDDFINLIESIEDEKLKESLTQLAKSIVNKKH